MTLTPAQQLVCNPIVGKIYRWSRGDRGVLMANVIALLAELTGQTMTCDQLKANAAEFNCLSPNAQLPAVIYLLSQIVSSQIAPSGAGYVFEFSSSGSGSPPPFTPTTPAAIATDISTGQQWNWYNGVWQ